MPDSLALWALLVPPTIGLLWALHESWSVFRVRLEGPLKSENKRIRGPLYEEVRPDKEPDPSISDTIVDVQMENGQIPNFIHNCPIILWPIRIITAQQIQFSQL